MYLHYGDVRAELSALLCRQLRTNHRQVIAPQNVGAFAHREAVGATEANA